MLTIVYIALRQPLKKAKITPDQSVSDISDALKKSMTEIKMDCLTGTNITWKSDGEPSKEPTVVTVQNGAYSIAQ